MPTKSAERASSFWFGETSTAQSAGLPKTRSGKIMRRVLRKIALKEEKELGDISTLADPGVVKDLIAKRP